MSRSDFIKDATFALLVALVFALIETLYIRHVIGSHIGQPHIFLSSGGPASLTEDLALNKARQAIALNGLDVSAWQPVRLGDRDGGGYLKRSKNVPDVGCIMFTNAAGQRQYMGVRLEGNRVICQSTEGL